MSVDGPSASTSPSRDDVADVHQRTLVDAGVLVRTRVLGQRVDIDAGVVVARSPFVHAHHDAAGIDLVDHAAATRRPRSRRSRAPPRARCRCRPAASRHAASARPGAACSAPISARLASSCSRNGHQRRRDRHGLHRRHVHVADISSGGAASDSSMVAAGDEVFGELAALRRRGEFACAMHVLAFVDRRQVTRSRRR